MAPPPAKRNKLKQADLAKNNPRRRKRQFSLDDNEKQIAKNDPSDALSNLLEQPIHRRTDGQSTRQIKFVFFLSAFFGAQFSSEAGQRRFWKDYQNFLGRLQWTEMKQTPPSHRSTWRTTRQELKLIGLQPNGNQNELSLEQWRETISSSKTTGLPRKAEPLVVLCRLDCIVPSHVLQLVPLR